MSCPPGDTVWWLVRDGLSRELLQPVAPWYEADGRRVLTLNSLGQAQNAGQLERLPIGVRAVTTLPFSRVLGYLSAAGLVLSEVPLGIFLAGLASRPCCAALALLLCIQPAWAMQQNLAVRVGSSSPVGWGIAPATEPAITRIWTYTLAGPTVVEYHPQPDPGYMVACIANTARGVVASGDFVWTSPRIIQGVAHLLHVPSGSAPPAIYWLLHFRGRATVVCIPRPVFDWQQIGQLAAEEFGLPLFGQGQFAVWHAGRIVPYGTQVPAPGHGTVVTLVRNVPSSSVGFTAWDAPADAPAAFHFEYDICRGPGGEPPLPGWIDCTVRPQCATARSGSQARPPASQAADAASDQGCAPAPSLVRQMNEVCHQLNILTSRLESAGLLPAADDDQRPAPVFQGVQGEATSTSRAEALMGKLCLCLLGALWLPPRRSGLPLYVLKGCSHGSWRRRRRSL